MAKLVYAGDLKSSGQNARAGSSPAIGTKIIAIIMETLTQIVKGKADMVSVQAGGIATYQITTEGHQYQLDIDLSDKHDVGETATFMCHYDRAIILMRWIRRAIEKGDFIEIF